MVLGAGPVGLLGALALLVRGFDTWIYSRESASSPRAAWVEKHRRAATSSRRSFRSATSASRWATSISSTRRPARRRWPSPPCPRSARTASSSSPAFRATRPPSRSTPSRSCAIWCSRTSSSTARSTPDRPRSSASIARSGEVQRALAGAGARAHHRALPARDRSPTSCRADNGGIKNVIRFGTPIGAAAGARPQQRGKGGARG